MYSGGAENFDFIGSARLVVEIDLPVLPIHFPPPFYIENDVL
jgi:hypothetical protein